MTRLWEHMPILSSQPTRLIDYKVKSEGNMYDEAALFELENKNFLFIRFSGLNDDVNVGFTDFEEFEDFDKAQQQYYNICEGL